ncbi:MAG: hypothetical protein R2838_14345 [Caldilineaceae bacterium]
MTKALHLRVMGHVMGGGDARLAHACQAHVSVDADEGAHPRRVAHPMRAEDGSGEGDGDGVGFEIGDAHGAAYHPPP